MRDDDRERFRGDFSPRDVGDPAESGKIRNHRARLTTNQRSLARASPREMHDFTLQILPPKRFPYLPDLCARESPFPSRAGTSSILQEYAADFHARHHIRAEIRLRITEM